MTIPEDTQQIYEQLALQCQRKKETLRRDVFLVLAADSAHTLGRAAHAQRLHRQLLQLSPSTMLCPFASFAEALGSGDVRSYVCDLRQQFPPETAAQMLDDSSTNQPIGLFDGPTESDIVIPATSSTLFDDGRPPSSVEILLGPSAAPAIQITGKTTAALLRGSSPSIPMSNGKELAHDVSSASLSSAAQSAPTLPHRPRRRSPYDNPDYGPKVPPAASSSSEEDAGLWFIQLLAGLIAVAGISALVYVLVRPFLAG